MADSVLNHSWPALSKLWLKRWAFKRGKEASSGPPPSQTPLKHWLIVRTGGLFLLGFFVCLFVCLFFFLPD